MAQGNSYEEARKQRLEDNKRRFQELGVSKIANSLSDVIKKKNKIPRKNQVKSKTAPVNPDLVRRSSRPRNQVTYYKGLRNIARVATKAEPSEALKRAMSFQSSLLSRNPSFVKSMTPSNVSMNFGLNIPLGFRNNHLPREAKVRILLEDEDVGLRDAVVIELIKPTRFKVHIFKVSDNAGEGKVSEPEKARESKSAKTVDAEQVCHNS
ncbi:hypothetical protein MKX01_027110 [Papaver californicum]|nr:hypothetical protein MKX01_027110 [Papaver californicum]